MGALALTKSSHPEEGVQYKYFRRVGTVNDIHTLNGVELGCVDNDNMVSIKVLKIPHPDVLRTLFGVAGSCDLRLDVSRRGCERATHNYTFLSILTAPKRQVESIIF